MDDAALKDLVSKSLASGEKADALREAISMSRVDYGEVRPIDCYGVLKCDREYTETAHFFWLHAGNWTGNQKSCVFPHSRLRFTVKPGSEILCVYDRTPLWSKRAS